MKKIIVLLLSLSILISLAIPSYAAGVDYEYSSEWFTAILNNTSWRGLDVDGTITRGTYSNSDTDFLSLNGKIFGYNSIGDEPYPVVINSFRGNDIRSINSYFPLDITVLPNQSIELSIILLFTSAIENPDDVFTSLGFTYNDVSYSFSGSSVGYDNIVLGDLIYNSSGDIITGLEPNYSSNGKYITYTYTNNTSVSQHISSVNWLVRSPSNTETFNTITFGFIANNTTAVVLPSYVENNLIQIGNELKKQTSYLDEITAILDILVEGMDSVGAAVGSISSSSSSYQDKVINPTPEDIEKEEEVSERIESEKQEQEEILATLDKVEDYNITKNQLDDISTEITTVLSSTKENKNLFDVFNDIFFGPFATIFITFVFTFATVSYVFFGKR